jgi:hypothetical protein
MLVVEPLPRPCPADRIPDATGLEAFEAACKAAKEQRVVFVAVEQQGPLWAVKADALTAPQHTIDSTVHDAVTSTARTRRPTAAWPASSCRCAGASGVGGQVGWGWPKRRS